MVAGLLSKSRCYRALAGLVTTTPAAANGIGAVTNAGVATLH